MRNIRSGVPVTPPSRIDPAQRAPFDASVIPWNEGPGIVELPDGRRIRGRSLRSLPVAASDPQLGVYLAAREPGKMEWDQRWVRWPDFLTPKNTLAAIAALQYAFDRFAIERGEIACRGGVGRTGTALAGIAVIAGIPPRDAIDWVRRRYNRRSVETVWQRRWILNLETSGLGNADALSR